MINKVWLATLMLIATVSVSVAQEVQVLVKLKFPGYTTPEGALHFSVEKVVDVKWCEPGTDFSQFDWKEEYTSIRVGTSSRAVAYEIEIDLDGTCRLAVIETSIEFLKLIGLGDRFERWVPTVTPRSSSAGGRTYESSTGVKWRKGVPLPRARDPEELKQDAAPVTIEKAPPPGLKPPKAHKRRPFTPYPSMLDPWSNVR